VIEDIDENNETRILEYKIFKEKVTSGEPISKLDSKIKSCISKI
jgi:hypothetical protein